MKLYAGKSILDYFADLENRLQNEINSQDESYILNVNDDDYTAHLRSKFAVDAPELHFDDVTVDSTEKDIPPAKFPSHASLFMDERYYKTEVFIYHIPYTGNVSLLQYRPNPWAMISIELAQDNRQSCLLVEVINFYNDADKIKQAYQQQLNTIQTNYKQLRTNCESYNNSLSHTVKSLIKNRKQKILAKSNLMASLGVPIKKRNGVAETFSIPKPILKEKIIVDKPVVNETGYKPEPTLDAQTFRQILKYINDIGLNLERLPSTYIGKSEEDIRDHIIMIIDPNFQLGSASGETFNKTGKTDINLRYDSNVIFIAECKYWKGEKSFLKTIDQLLGYLTWRNSKAAIINFVQNSEFSDVLVKIKEACPKHSNYLKHVDDSTETQFNYKFHINGDRNREIDLSIISFHLPKI